MSEMEWLSGDEQFETSLIRPVKKKRVNLYTDAAVADLSPDQRKNFLNLARKELQRQILDEELEVDWHTATANIEPAVIGHGVTRCWMEVEVR